MKHTKTARSRTKRQSVRNDELNPAPEDELRKFLAEAILRCQAPGGERKQDRSKRRDQEIMRAALRIFARDGISRSRIGDIASEAGMPVSTIYEYYDSKEELAYVVPMSTMAAFFSEYSAAIENLATARERLRMYLWLAADFARRNPEWARVLYLEIWPSVMVTASSLRHSFDDYMRVILRLIRQGEEAGEWAAGPDHYETAAILNSSVNQIIITSLLYRRPRNLSAAASSIVDRTMALLPPVAGRRSAQRARPTPRPSRKAMV